MEPTTTNSTRKERPYTYKSKLAISPIFCRIYDIIIKNRFKQCYQPNMHQAGFRKGQGCTLQIFALLLSLIKAKICGKKLYIMLLDYEKAFDYINRAEMLNKLMKKNYGKKFIQNFANTYKNTTYVPKITANTLGENIETSQGLTQGDILILYIRYV